MQQTIRFLARVVEAGACNVGVDCHIRVRSLRHGTEHCVEWKRSDDRENVIFVGETLLVSVRNDLESERTTKAIVREHVIPTGECYFGETGELWVKITDGNSVPYNPQSHGEFLKGVELTPTKLTFKVPEGSESGAA